jgi:hypothetical protein
MQELRNIVVETLDRVLDIEHLFVDPLTTQVLEES